MSRDLDELECMGTSELVQAMVETFGENDYWCRSETEMINALATGSL